MVINRQVREAREKAVQELAAELAAGTKKVHTNMMTGEVTISDWAGSAAQRAGMCQGCAVNAVKAKGWATRATAKKKAKAKKKLKAGRR